MTERLVGLTEMFPDRFRHGATKSVEFALNSVKSKSRCIIIANLAC